MAKPIKVRDGKIKVGIRKEKKVNNNHQEEEKGKTYKNHNNSMKILPFSPNFLTLSEVCMDFSLVLIVILRKT